MIGYLFIGHLPTDPPSPDECAPPTEAEVARAIATQGPAPITSADFSFGPTTPYPDLPF